MAAVWWRKWYTWLKLIDYNEIRVRDANDQIWFIRNFAWLQWVNYITSVLIIHHLFPQVNRVHPRSEQRKERKSSRSMPHPVTQRNSALALIRSCIALSPYIKAIDQPAPISPLNFHIINPLCTNANSRSWPWIQRTNNLYFRYRL